jgi:hypothetical protein
VSKALVQNNKQEDKFKKHFIKKVVKDLEMNTVKVCNPSADPKSLK